MKLVLIVLVLVAAGVVGLGFYQGWFHLGSDSADGKSNFTLSVDKEKFQEDTQKAKSKVAGASDQTMDGTVVSVSADNLTMTNTEGKEQSHTLAANVKVTCDGKTCTPADLKPGMRVRVTTANAEPHAVTRLEALDTNRSFGKDA
jgi:translation elongation factor P/translation initiation factor 5A